MPSTNIEAALNAQIQEEIYSSYLYLAMAAYCHSVNLNGFAHWMKIQSSEESKHAMKLYDFVVQRGWRVLLKEIKKPPHNFKSVTEMMEQTLEHESRVTGLFNKLYEDASKAKDYATQVLLQWFISEQVEEEASVSEILQKLRLIADKSSAIIYLDKEMKKRQASS